VGPSRHRTVVAEQPWAVLVRDKKRAPRLISEHIYFIAPQCGVLLRSVLSLSGVGHLGQVATS
jgi:hypothetical protein